MQGVYEVSFVPEMAGMYALNVMLGGASIRECPMRIKVLADETLAKNCRCFGSGMAHATAGEPTSFTIQAVDGRGVARKSGGDQFEISITGPEGDSPHAKIRDNAEGTYTVTWAGKHAGLYAVRVQLDGASVGGTPFNCNVLPTAIAPAQCDVQANSSSLVRAGERAEFRIIARDTYGNVRSQGGDEFAVLVRMVEGPGKTEVQAHVTEESKGFYKAAFVVKHTGVYQVLVTAEGQPIKGVPFKCSVNSGRPDFTKCKLGGPGLQAVRLGQPCDVLVELYDVYSNRITSALDALSDIQVRARRLARLARPALASGTARDVAAGAGDGGWAVAHDGQRGGHEGGRGVLPVRGDASGRVHGGGDNRRPPHQQLARHRHCLHRQALRAQLRGARTRRTVTGAWRAE